MLLKIIDCDHGFFEPELSAAKELGVKIEIGDCDTEEEVIAFAKDADAILVQRTQITKSIMKGLPKCKVIARYGSGVDNVDFEAAKSLGVKVVYAPYFCFEDVANHTLGLLLSITRRIPFVTNAWKKDPQGYNKKYDKRLDQLKGVRRPAKQTLGIVGFGKIGAGVAARAQSFGYNVIAYDPYVTAQWMDSKRVTKIEKLNTLMEKSDIVTFHCPLTPETTGMMGAEQFKKLKKGTCLINAARGPIVQEKALVEALENGTLAAAALDVQEIEPLPTTSKLYHFDNVLITPHVAFFSEESYHDLKDRVTRYAVHALREDGFYEELK